MSSQTETLSELQAGDRKAFAVHLQWAAMLCYPLELLYLHTWSMAIDNE